MYRVVELFAGIGGFRASWPGAEVVRAIDVNQDAAHVYRCNFHCPYEVRDLTAVGPEAMRAWAADLWWLSPPCQPFTRRGQRRDITDSRSAGLNHLTQLVGQLQPQALALENVLGFDGSMAHQALCEQLTQAGYSILQRSLCPTELGWPNRRPRFYLLASQRPLASWKPLPSYTHRLCDLLLKVPDSSTLWMSPAVIEGYFSAIDRVDANDPSCVTACFGSSYGKVIPRAGSYLQVGQRYRRFAPREVARLLGYSDEFCLCLERDVPEAVRNRKLWKLLGNSLSLPAVRYVLSHLPFA